jgi:putative nucleotidyltransferase with HDIG domain
MKIILDQVNEYAIATTNMRVRWLQTLSGHLLGSKIDPTELIEAFPTNTVKDAQSALAKGIKGTMSRGILSDDYRVTMFSDAPDRMLTILRDEELQSRTLPQKDILSPEQAIRTISTAFNDKQQQSVLNRLLTLLVVDNLVYDETATANAKRMAEEAVPPVIQRYPANTPLVRDGEEVTPQVQLLLKHHEAQRIAEQDVLDQTLEIVGNAIMLLAGLIATAVILRVVNPALIRQPDKLLLMVILSLITLGAARLLTFLSLQRTLIDVSYLIYLIPYALAVLLAGILLNGGAAITLGFWCSFAAAVLLGQSFNVFALGILITITAASTARNIHRRSSLFRAGLWICAVKALYVLVSASLNRLQMQYLIGQVAVAITSGMLATILTLLLVPVFEKLFKITTDITLLELSDMGHPLLQKMAIQAPGTYHHSLMVATLAQNAAEVVGANSLLIRVCAYYHDIGKMAKPEFFTENIQHKENPHDELSPHMSALVISSHVKEGLALAKRHRLPQPVLDAIEQHHGNGLISFFYHKARTQYKKELDSSKAMPVNESDFRYGGAPAISPEMAILSLADSAEAAARSIEKPTPKKIGSMMDDIFAAKIRDGQMDHARLTMAEINAVKESFIFSLSNMLHGRIAYPKEHENDSDQPAEEPSDPAPKPSAAD